MNTLNKLAIICLLITFMASCDQVLNKAGSEFLKMGLKDTCGEEDPACIAAVISQFDSCHTKYEKDWNRYMNSSLSNEDELLEVYSRGVYGCIVDEDGDPYFVFDPD